MRDGALVAWGSSASGAGPSRQFRIPEGVTNVVAVALGLVRNLALLGDDPLSRVVKITNPMIQAGRFACSIATQSGRVYRLEFKDSLDALNWTDLPLAAGTGGTLTLRDSLSVADQRFYRVRRW